MKYLVTDIAIHLSMTLILTNKYCRSNGSQFSDFEIYFRALHLLNIRGSRWGYLKSSEIGNQHKHEIYDNFFRQTNHVKPGNDRSM